MDRREFLKATALFGAAAVRGGPIVDHPADRLVPKRTLGKTGASVSVLGLGGITVMQATQDETDEIVGFALDHGVNYFDVAPSYGHAEERYGPALAGQRERIFLACKTLERSKEGAAKELRTSLARLRTDHLDLYQIHALNSVADVDQVLAPGGAIEAFTAARQEGLIRFIGFSAHSADAALDAMRRFEFDTVMFPINWVSYYTAQFGPQVVEAARARQMGIIAIKSVAPLTPAPDAVARAGALPARSAEELTALGLRFALTEPIAVALPRGHAPTFRQAVAVAAEFTELSAAERGDLQARAAAYVPLFPQKPQA
jgi:aryl-alcohol dehydrogenase-like predicted oxidoreductase